IPESLSSLVEACISLHPGDRPNSFTEIRKELETNAHHTKTTTRPEVAGPPESVYDIALSYAGCDRPVSETIYLKHRSHCRVVFDRDPLRKADLWGSDLSTHLHQVYSEQSKFCIVLISREYVECVWTNWERRAILQRMANARTGQYVLPVQIRLYS